MRKILFMILTVLVSCKSKQEIAVLQEMITTSISKNPNYISLQKVQGDTLKYLQINFLENQYFYRNKPLNVLLNDLELDIKAYSNSYGSNLYLSDGLSLNFYSRSEKKIKISNIKNPLVLVVQWETPLPQENIVKLLRKNKGQWTEEEKEYYGQHILKEIGMVVPNY